MNHCGTKTLETKRLVLRKFHLNDAEDMFRNWASNPNVTKFLIWEPYTNVDDVRAYIQSCIDCYEKRITTTGLLNTKKTVRLSAISALLNLRSKHAVRLSVIVSAKNTGARV